MSTQSRFEREKEIFTRLGGILRTSEAIRAGIHPRILYAMRDAGEVEKLSRGIYRLSELPPLLHPDLVSVALRAPKGVICLVSALAYHGITTQIPHEVYLALPRGRKLSTADHPPVRVFWFGVRSFAEGIEIHKLDRVRVNIYSLEKTLADCFKYRNKIGFDTAIEALRFYRDHRSVKVDELIRCAKACRVQNVMRPYLEVLLS